MNNLFAKYLLQKNGMDENNFEGIIIIVSGITSNAIPGPDSGLFSSKHLSKLH